jgi:hypothetical protein
MTNKPKITYGADIAINSLDEGFTFWQATVTVHKLEPDEDAPGRWVSYGTRNTDSVQFQMRATDYCWKFEDRHTLGLPTHGDWIIDARWHHEFQAQEAIDAGRLALRLDKRMMNLARQWGNPSTPCETLRRALQTIKPVAVRVASRYQGKTGVDASRQWEDTQKGTTGLFDFLIHQEWNHWRDVFTAKRPDLFQREKEVAT